MVTLSVRLPPDAAAEVDFTLSLTAEERRRSRLKLETAEGVKISLKLPRGTVLGDCDLLCSATDNLLARVIAQPEPILIVSATTRLELLRAAYHLGNRHVPIEITEMDLRLSPDSVLQRLLAHLGLQVIEAYQPFQPEGGAYDHNHAESHPS